MRHIVQGSSIAIGPAVLLSTAMVVCAGVCWFFSKKRSNAPKRRVSAERRRPRTDYFRLRRIGSGDHADWLLEGFGRFQCSLGFDSWREAMNQVRFRLEMLGMGEVESLSAGS
ncbi:MAG: hypothetical protein JO033_08120 [Acidobacteriaceae bacterium]|nr:hypothetical protein [Acidobacteriaceae bacterium]MBV9502765.1 hypothetical protein [Acidobacteriaceae bacterium]